jgi:hypothetical protein
MKKFCWPFILYSVLLTGLVFTLFNHDRVTGPDPLSLSFVFTLAPFVFYVAIGAIWTHEQIEYKFKGYTFLKLLPIKDRDIVLVKFILVYLSVLIFVIFNVIAFAAISKDPNFFDPSRSFMVLNGVLCLVLSAFLYLLIFRFGFDKLGKYIFIVWTIILAAPIILVIFVLPKIGLTRTEIIMFFAKVNWILLGAAGTIVYFGLMQLAVKAKKTFQY